MPSSNYAEQWILGPLETSFYTRLYMPKDVPIRAAMVFVHGYLEHIGRYETFHSAWAARGVAVFAYDERGFGRTALDEKKSAKSVYGQTGGAVERMLDVQWAIKYTRGKVERVPLFLMGHSMGGGQVLSFATRTESPPDKETVAMLSGVIASSPLVHITKPPPSALVRLLTMVGKVFPNTVLSTPVQDKELSHDPTIGEDSLKDPWIKGIGTIRGLTDMLNRGALLLSQGYKCWPQDLPVLMLHGTKDMVNSCPSTEKFFEVLQAPDKQLIIYPDMWHDLMTEPAVKEQYFEDCASWLEEDAGASLRRSSLYRCSFNRDQGAFMLKKGLKASIRDHGTPTSSTYWAQTLSPVTERVRAWKEALVLLVAPKCTLCNTRESPPLALRPTDVDGHHQNCTDGPWRARVG